MTEFINITVIRARDLAPELSRLSVEYRSRALIALDATGLVVQNYARKLIQDGPKSGRLYKISKTVTHRASAPGEAPANRLGALVSSIAYQVDDALLAVVVRAATAYAVHLEFGTRKMAARPFMRRSVVDNVDKIHIIFRTAMAGPLGPTINSTRPRRPRP